MNGNYNRYKFEDRRVKVIFVCHIKFDGTDLFCKVTIISLLGYMLHAFHLGHWALKDKINTMSRNIGD
jgi:hypothetical protein